MDKWIALALHRDLHGDYFEVHGRRQQPRRVRDGTVEGSRHVLDAWETRGQRRQTHLFCRVGFRVQ